MCGRYRRRSDKQRIAEAFSVSVGLEELYLEPENDIAPGSVQPVIFTNPDGERQIQLMRWGFQLPDRLLFNARSEGIERANFWKESFRQRRCIVPADSFYEWEHLRKKNNRKYEFHVNGLPLFGMAGIWNVWTNPKTGKPEQTFAIITTDPNTIMQPIHDRQPSIIEPRQYTEWLAPAERDASHLNRVLPDNAMKVDCASTAAGLTDFQTKLFDSQ